MIGERLSFNRCLALAIVFSGIFMTGFWRVHEEPRALSHQNGETGATHASSGRRGLEKAGEDDGSGVSLWPIVRPGDRPYIKAMIGCGECSPIVVESHKLIFFTIPKVGCTAWKFVFRRMMQIEDWSAYGNKRGIPHNKKINGLVYLHDYDLYTANKIMTAPDWTRAIFVRDPKARLLSAYLDKVYPRGPALIKCCQRNADCMEKSKPFENFVRYLLPRCTNDHWRPQYLQMPSRYWKQINFVGHIENLEEDSKRLLERIGAWEDYGASGWGPFGNESLFQENEIPKHSTGADDKMKLHYSPELEREVERIYAYEYQNPVMNLTLLSYNY